LDQAAETVTAGGGEELRAEQRGLYWPSVSVIGGYAHLNDRLFVDLSDPRGLQPLNPDVPVPPLSATVLRNDPIKATLAELCESGDVLPCDGGLIGVAPRAVP